MNLLTQTEINALEAGDLVEIVWSGGNGPHRYTIDRNPAGVLALEAHAYVDSVGAAPPSTTVKLIIRAQDRCYCGWHERGKCPHCPPVKSLKDKITDRGNAVRSSVCECNDHADLAAEMCC